MVTKKMVIQSTVLPAAAIAEDSLFSFLLFVCLTLLCGKSPYFVDYVVYH